MIRFVILLCLSLIITTTTAQDKPTIYIDIPTEQKPWNHIKWNESPQQFQFAIVTDRTGSHRPGVFPTGIKKLNLLQPEFVMSVGDLIEGYTRDTTRLNAEWKEFMSFIEPLEAPFFYVPGNHDITNEVMEEKWMELFGVSYYHFVYKDVLFLCLNSEDNLRGSGRGTLDDEQYEFVKKTLEENADVKWTLVFLHQPLWVQQDTKRWKDVETLLSDRNHNVFAGHYHRYWKSARNNGKYIALATTGGGSRLRGRAYGEFDHVVWVTMTEEGPILANLFLDGIWDDNVVTEDIVDLVRNRPFPVKISPIYLEEPNAEEMIAEIKATNDSDSRMQVSLKGHAHDKMLYQLEQTSFTVEPNSVTTFNLHMKNVDRTALNKLGAFTVTADIIYEFEQQPNVSFTADLSYKPFVKNTIKKASRVKLDGNLKEWKDASWISVDNWDGAPFDYDGAEDCSLKFATSYDKNNLYVALDLKDNDFLINENGSHFNQDAIMLGLDARPEHQSAFSKGSGRGRDWIAYLRTFRSNNPVYGSSRLPTEVTSEVQMTKTGATIEMAFPLEYIEKMSGGDWSSLRFGIGYYDYDSQDEGATTHYWFPAWNAVNDIPGSGMLFKD